MPQCQNDVAARMVIAWTVSVFFFPWMPLVPKKLMQSQKGEKKQFNADLFSFSCLPFLPLQEEYLNPLRAAPPVQRN